MMIWALLSEDSFSGRTTNRMISCEPEASSSSGTSLSSHQWSQCTAEREGYHWSRERSWRAGLDLAGRGRRICMAQRWAPGPYHMPVRCQSRNARMGCFCTGEDGWRPGRAMAVKTFKWTRRSCCPTGQSEKQAGAFSTSAFRIAAHWARLFRNSFDRWYETRLFSSVVFCCKSCVTISDLLMLMAVVSRPSFAEQFQSKVLNRWRKLN